MSHAKFLKIHIFTLNILRLELIFYPVLFLLQYGMGVDLGASFFLRFFYITYFFASLLYIIKSKKIYLNLLSFIFALFLSIALLKGIWRQQFNSAFLSHLFYFIMPIAMISYGKNIGLALMENSELVNHFTKIIKDSLIIGVISIIVFNLFIYFGTALYDAIDIWNVLISFPYYLSIGSQGHVLLILIMLMLSGKRVTLLAGLCMFFWFKMKGKKYIKYLIMVIFLLLVASVPLIINSDIELPDIRLFRALSYAQADQFDLAFAGRLSESLEAINNLILDPTGILLGAGLGGQFYPWPEIDGAENYISHYTHFTFVSYLWIGGIGFPILVYFILILQLHKVSKLAFSNNNLILTTFSLYMVMAIVSSLSGAVLMNNSFLWLIIGASFGLVRGRIQH